MPVPGGKLSEPSLGGGAVTTAQVALTDAPSASLVFARSPRSSPWRPAPLLASWQVAQLSSGPVAGQSAAGTRWGGGVREPGRGGRRRQGLRQGPEEPAGGHGCVTPPRAATRRGLRVRCQQRLRFLWRVRDRGVPRGEEGRLGLCPAVRGPSAVEATRTVRRTAGPAARCPLGPSRCGSREPGLLLSSAVQGERAFCGRWLSTPRRDRRDPRSGERTVRSQLNGVAGPRGFRVTRVRRAWHRVVWAGGGRGAGSGGGA